MQEMNTVILDLPGTWSLGEFRLRNGGYVPFEKYLKLDVEGVRLEWLDGKVIGYKFSSLTHQEISSFLEVLMTLFVESRKLGEVIRAGYAMKLSAQKRGREPDLLFVKTENLHRLKHNFLDGAADLAVEIISPESIERDTEEKFFEYQAAGITEYWLINPETKEANFYILDENQTYKPTKIKDGFFDSTVIEGFSLNVENLWDESPNALKALQELNLIQ